MKQKVLKVKDWLIERDNKPQFEFITEVLVKRLKDNVLFKVGKTNYATFDGIWYIHNFYTNRININISLTSVEQEGKRHKWAINDLPPY